MMIRTEQCLEEKDFLIKAKDVFGGKNENMINYEKYDEESLFNIYINGKMFHTDSEKNEKYLLSRICLDCQ